MSVSDVREARDRWSAPFVLRPGAVGDYGNLWAHSYSRQPVTSAVQR